jgi:hypothetical protein
MRQALSLALVFLVVTHLSPTASPAENVTGQITGMRMGVTIELQLKNKQTLRGTRGEVSASGFTLTDPSGGNRQIAFDEVASVKQLTKKSHTKRNVLLGVGIAVAVVVAVGVALAATRAVTVYN